MIEQFLMCIIVDASNGGFYQKTRRFRADTELVAEWRETRLFNVGSHMKSAHRKNMPKS